MAARLAALVPRFVLLTLLWLLTTATFTFAAEKRISSAPPSTTPPQAEPKVLVVPDVRRQAYVFAKGILDDGGFAWRVEGGVRGYAANLVATQQPAPGTRVLDTGAPTVVLRLSRNPQYRQHGSPENAAPYAGTRVALAEVASAPAAKRPVRASGPGEGVRGNREVPPAGKRPVEKHAARAERAPSGTEPPQRRPPAFVVPGAPKEPLGEMPLPARARLLGVWLSSHPEPTPANVNHWLYQHSWIVTGARLGWWRGAEALRLLIQIDRKAQALWGLGARSEAVARAALAEVEARAR